MKSHEPESWIDVRRMPPGRRQWIYSNTAALLPSTMERLLGLCRAGEAAEKEQLDVMLRFKGGQQATDPTRTWPRAVVDLDVAVDRRVGALRDLFRSMVNLYDGKPSGPAWVALDAATFPTGATYYTAQPYIEESARIASLLNVLQAAEWKALTSLTIVSDAIADLAEAFRPYAEAVRRFDPVQRTPWEEVKRLDLANHRRLAELVAGIVYELAHDDATRKAALGPLALQDQEVYEALRQRRAVLDVNPTTGEPLAPAVTPPEPSPTS